MTLAKAFTSVKPSVSHLKVFGCDPYVHISDHKRTKFESKTYSLSDLESKSVVISRDVNFLEPKLDDPRILPKFHS